MSISVRPSSPRPSTRPGLRLTRLLSGTETLRAPRGPLAQGRHPPEPLLRRRPPGPAHRADGRGRSDDDDAGLASDQGRRRRRPGRGDRADPAERGGRAAQRRGAGLAAAEPVPERGGCWIVWASLSPPPPFFPGVRRAVGFYYRDGRLLTEVFGGYSFR
jgi:hypothetical protein